MRLRVLVGGLTFFALSILAAVAPFMAQGHSPSVKKPCTITGTSGADLLGGTSGPDVICGFGGNDTIGGGGGNDVIRGGPGNDRLQGDLGRDAVLGQAGNDLVWVRDGLHDHALGGKGYDRYRVDRSLDTKRGFEAAM